MAVTKKEESLKDILQARPMSKLSDAFYSKDVGRVKGKLVYFNDELFPRLSAVKEDIAKELSLFVDWSGKNAEFEAKALPTHSRSFSFNHILVDKEGRVWKYVCVKGGGMSMRNIPEDIQPVDQHDRLHEAQGLFDIEGAIADRDFSMLFLKNGVKTTAPFMIIEITEVIMKDGGRKSIEDLKKARKLTKKIRYDKEILPYRPVLYVRLFSEVMRLQDAKKQDFEKFASEHGMSPKEYRRWWIERGAQNLAGIHRLGKYHGNISSHNLTLDGCIVDNDGVKDVSFDDATRIDLTDFLCSILYCVPASETRELSRTFIEKYLEGRGNIEERELKHLEAEFGGHYSSFGRDLRLAYAEFGDAIAMEIQRRFNRKAAASSDAA